jgi:hypothetical protein
MSGAKHRGFIGPERELSRVLPRSDLHVSFTSFLRKGFLHDQCAFVIPEQAGIQLGVQFSARR